MFRSHRIPRPKSHLPILRSLSENSGRREGKAD